MAPRKSLHTVMAWGYPPYSLECFPNIQEALRRLNDAGHTWVIALR